MPRIDVTMRVLYCVNRHLDRPRRRNFDRLRRTVQPTSRATIETHPRHMLAEALALTCPRLDGPGLDLATGALQRPQFSSLSSAREQCPPFEGVTA